MTTAVAPHDPDAEESLLGAMLLSTQAVETAAVELSPEDFYVPKHQLVFDAITRLWIDGLATDPVSVAALLRDEKTVDQIGGPGFLLTLQSGTPSTSSAPRYTQVIRTHASRRKLIALGLELANQARDMGDPDVIAEWGRTEFASIGGPGLAVPDPDDLTTVDEFLRKAHAAPAPWVVPGLLRAGSRCLIVAPEGSGKALELSTKIPTPEGWTTMGQLKVGDRVFDQHGKACNVTALSTINPSPESYEIVFNDGVRIKACGDHQWVTIDYTRRQPWRKDQWEQHVHNTREIKDTLHARGGHTANHAVPVGGALDLPEADLPLDPYLLGVWLGDGSSTNGSVALSDRDGHSILTTIKERTDFTFHIVPSTLDDGKACLLYRFDGLTQTLDKAGLRGVTGRSEKHIPAAYLRASFEQRLALLQGIMDTDGYVADGSGKGRGSGAAHCEISFMNERLAVDTLELVRTMGIIASFGESDAQLNGRVVGRRWRIGFQTDLPVATVPFKASRLQPLRTQRAKLRYIKDVVPCEPEPMRCIEVDSPDHTYLITEHMIPTHNSVVSRQVAIAAAQGVHPFFFNPITPVRTLIVDLENPDDALADTCRPIVDMAKGATLDYEEGRAWLWRQPGGINLRDRAAKGQLESVIAACQPDLVCLGPLYKAYRAGRESDEIAVGEVQAVFDDLRTRYNFSLLMEHHAPKGGGLSIREMLPHGSALWMRWPELGIGMMPGADDTAPDTSLTLGRFRGDRITVAWPDRLDRGGPNRWPWIGYWKNGYTP